MDTSNRICWKMQKRKLGLKIEHLNRTEVTEFPFKKQAALNFNSSQRDSRSTSGGTTTPTGVGKTPLSTSKTDLLANAVQQKLSLHPLSARNNDPDDKAEFIDPLTELLVNKETAAFKPAKTVNIESWSSRKTKLLASSLTASTGEKLTFYSSFLGELASQSAATATTIATRYDSAYDDLNQTETLRRETNLTPSEYKNRIEALSTLLAKFWRQEERVKSLKIATECATLLTIDTKIATGFYAAKFIWITDLLDKFSELVYARIKSKSDSAVVTATSGRSTVARFVASETARNWFQKVSEIQQLVPRTFLELALVKCYDFIDDSKFTYDRTLLRLARSVRGIADPLVALYARCYLSRVAIALDSKLFRREDDNDADSNGDFGARRLFCENLFDFYLSLNPEYQPASRRHPDRVKNTKEFLFGSQQVAVLEPALDFVTATAVEMAQRRLGSADDETLETILDNYEQNAIPATGTVLPIDLDANGSVLNCLLRHMPQRFVADRVFVVFELVQQLLPIPELVKRPGTENGCRRSSTRSSPIVPKLIATIANCLVQFRPDRDKRPHILRRFYAIVEAAAVVSSGAERMRCLDSFADFICLSYTNVEIAELLRHVLSLAEAAAENSAAIDSLDAAMKSIVLKILKNVSFRSFLKLDSVYDVVKLIRAATVVYDVNRAIISQLAKQLDLEVDESSNLARNLLQACQQLHDNLTIFCSSDERKQIDQFVANFVARIRFTPDRSLDAQLQFYMECRQKFADFDQVFAQLVHSVNRLCARTVLGQVTSNRPSNGNGADEPESIRSFVKACLTFCSITIVSITSTATKLKLFLLTAQVALMSHHYVHVDLCLKSIFELLPESGSCDELLVSFLRNVLSFLRLVPECPEERSQLGFVKTFVDFIRDLENGSGTSKGTIKAVLYLNVLDLLAALAQSNCTGSGHSGESMVPSGEPHAPDYEQTLNELAALVVEHVIRELNDLSKLEMREQQAFLSFELFVRIASHADLEPDPKLDKLRDLAATLWSFCRQFPFNAKLLQSTSTHLQAYCLSGPISKVILT